MKRRGRPGVIPVTAPIDTSGGIWCNPRIDEYFVIKNGGVVRRTAHLAWAKEYLHGEDWIASPRDPAEYGIHFSTGTGIWYGAGTRQFQVIIKGATRGHQHHTLLSARSALREGTKGRNR